MKTPRAKSWWAKLVFLFRVWKVWRSRPQMPFGQLIRLACLGQHQHRMSDRDLLFSLERLDAKKRKR